MWGIAGVLAVWAVAAACQIWRDHSDDHDNTREGRQPGATPYPTDSFSMASATPAPTLETDPTQKPQATVSPTPSLPLAKYSPPADPVFPEVQTDGISHFQLMVGNEPTRGSWPLSFQCREADQSCYFGMLNKIFSFPASHNGDRPLTPVADFSPQIDGQTTFLASMARSEELYYGLFDSFEPTLQPGPGIAIRTSGNEALSTYIFPIQEGAPLTSPNSLLDVGAHFYVSFSRYMPGEDTFNPGKIFRLEKTGDGNLMEDPSMPPVTTTQFNPQKLQEWRIGEKSYVLAVNTGATTVLGAITSEAGLDVIDAETHVIVANVPLGNGAANTFVVTPDGAAAFFASQILSSIYVVDLERLKTTLMTINPMETSEENRVPTFRDVVIADATNPVAINGMGSAFVPTILYDEGSASLILSSFNDDELIQVYAGYETTPGVGISLKPGFGEVIARFDCSMPTANWCSQADLVSSGVVALTGQPASGTFIPNESLAQRQDH